MQRKPPGLTTIPQISDHRKPDAADYDQRCNHAIHRQIADITGDAAIFAKQVKTCIAKGRDRMPIAEIYSLQTEVPKPAYRQDRSADQLHQQRCSDNVERQPHYASQIELVCCLLDQQTFLEIDLFTAEHRNQGCYCHDAQPADLDQQQDYALTKY